MLNELKARKDMALNKYALAAYYVHPFYDNALLEEKHIQQINNFLLMNLNADGLEDWHKFKNKEGIFEILYKKDVKKPEVFWSTAEFSHPNMAGLALKLLNLPAFSANIERIFSSWGNIHSAIRNKLTFPRSKKLLHLHYYLNNNNEENVILYDDEDDD